MEYLKPWIQRRQARRTMIAQLNDEFFSNMEFVEKARAILDSGAESEHGRVTTAALMLTPAHTDRFDHFFAAEKTLVYDYDKSLVTFYRLASKLLAEALLRSNENDIKAVIDMVLDTSDKYVESHPLPRK